MWNVLYKLVIATTKETLKLIIEKTTGTMKLGIWNVAQ
jgi:hypothetical protein